MINSLPIAVEDLATTTKGQSVNLNVLINDTDPDLEDVLTVLEGFITTKNGTLVLNEDDTFTYTPNEGYLGEDSFTYFITDGFNSSSEMKVVIIIIEETTTQEF